MIQNQTESAVQEKLRAESVANPLAEAVAAAAQLREEAFEIEAGNCGLEIVARTPLPNRIPNRARLKIFSPKPGHTLVFFFKKSLVPYSRDRYSYGGIDARGTTIAAEEIAAWLSFLASGFHPDLRPEDLRRAFPYEIPD